MIERSAARPSPGSAPPTQPFIHSSILSPSTHLPSIHVSGLSSVRPIIAPGITLTRQSWLSPLSPARQSVRAVLLGRHLASPEGGVHPTPCHTRALLFSDSGDPCPRLLTPPLTDSYILHPPLPSPRPPRDLARAVASSSSHRCWRASSARPSLRWGWGHSRGGLMKDCSAPRSWWHRGHVDPSDHNSHSQTCHL